MPTSSPHPPSVTPAKPPLQESRRKEFKTIDFDQFVDKRIERTRRTVKVADLFSAVAVLLIGIISLLLVAAIAEHWLVTGGFGTNERAGLWAIMLIGSGVYFARYIFPLLTHRVNKLYAADELERESPELKNSLVNLLQLREQGVPSPVIQQILEQQAAERLAVVEDHGVDLGPLLRVGYVLAGVIALTGLYIILSPKDFFTSAQRVILPWSEVAAPSRVAIEDLSPGDTVLSQGDRLPVSLRIIGLQPEETAELIYTTTDGRVDEKRVPLSAEEGSVRYTTELPSSLSTLGLQSDLKYRIEAGDARTRNYQVEVLTTPTIAPQTIRYEYPEYTGYVNRTVEGGGDLRAIEGTRVTLTTEANLPIETAQIDFNADGRPDVRMKTDGQRAMATFLMKRRGDTLGFAPETSSYVLRFTSTEGKTNLKPARYERVVLADLPPEARLIFPEEAVRKVRLDDSIEIAVEARDPDFALSGVWLVGEVDGKQVLNEWLLKPARRDKGHQGKYVANHWVTPRKLGLVGGEMLDYWVEAADNREPSPNRNRSEKQQLLIAADNNSGKPSEQGEENPEDGANEDGAEDGVAEDGAPADAAPSKDNPSNDGQSNEGQANQRQPGDKEKNQPEGNQPDKESQPNNPEGENTEANSDPSEQDNASEGEQNQEGIQGEGDENSKGQRNNSPESGEGTPSERLNNEPQEPESNQQGRGNGSERDVPRDPNQEQGREGSDSSGGEQVQTKDNSPVADDGSDDGAAFDKIREHLAKKREATEEETNADNPNRQQQTNEEGQGENAEHPQASDSESADSKQGEPRDTTGEDPERDPQASPQESQDGNQSGKQSDSQSSKSTNSAERGQDSKPNDGPRQGTGSSGQNQAADDGSGQAGDRGEGESTGRSGNQQSSDENSTGQPNENATSETAEGGRPGEQRNSTDNQSPNGKTSSGNEENSPGSQSSNRKNSQDPKDQNTEGLGSQSNDSADNNAMSDRADNQSEPRDGNPQGPAHGSGSEAFDRPDGTTDDAEPGGDEANLDYARKQTELVLDELSDQMEKQQVDQELLDELGWSEKDLQRFVNRWQARRLRADENREQGKSELDAALRSLGLSPEEQRLDRSPKANDDALRDLQQGRRTTIPPALRERLQRYNRGISRDESR